MNANFTAGILLILLSGIFQGTYGLGMKKFQPLAWEAFWILFSITGMIVLPVVCVWWLIPDPIAALSSISRGDAIAVILMGAMWGVGALLWGFSVLRLGLSLTYGIGMSFTAISGSFGALFFTEDALSKPYFWYLVAGNVVMVLGVALITVAGVIRERKENAGKGQKTGKIDLTFLLALVGIVVSGVCSGLLNIGFGRASAAGQAAVEQGASPADASLVQWLLVFCGGFVVQFLYTLFLLIRNRSYKTFAAPRSGKAYGITFLTALLWFAALAVYGRGASIMGGSGQVLGWTMFIAVSLIVSNVWAILAGEWKVRRSIPWLIAGNAVLIASWIVLGYANSL